MFRILGFYFAKFGLDEIADKKDHRFDITPRLKMS